jgi:hypothetical protein
MNKLWVYGCSFSEPFGIQHGGAEWDNQGYRIITQPYWGTHLSERLNLKCITRSLSGVGWNYINDRIDEDILDWGNNDIIIVSPSFFSRVTFEELVKRDSQTELADKFHDWNYVYIYNEARWRRKIATLQHFGYRVYTWLVDHTPDANTVKNLITAPSGHYNWKDWMDLNKQYWQDPTTNKYPLGDWHFNAQGHRAVADRMAEYICQLP